MNLPIPFKNQTLLQSVLKTCFAILALTGILACPPVYAGSLNITLSMTSRVFQDRLTVDVTVANLGTSTAYGATVAVTALGRSFDHNQTTDMIPGTSPVFSFEIPFENLIQGTYPVIAFCRFKDYDGYSFSAINASTFTVGSDCDQKLSGEITTKSIQKTSTAVLSLQNLSKNNIDATIQLVLPDEFSGTMDLNIRLAKESKQDMKIQITNKSALPGASYPIFCVIEYDADGCHHSFITGGSLNITKKSDENPLYSLRWYLLVGVTTFSAGLLLFGAIKPLRKTRIGL